MTIAEKKIQSDHKTEDFQLIHNKIVRKARSSRPRATKLCDIRVNPETSLCEEQKWEGGLGGVKRSFAATRHPTWINIF